MIYQDVIMSISDEQNSNKSIYFTSRGSSSFFLSQKRSKFLIPLLSREILLVFSIESNVKRAETSHFVILHFIIGIFYYFLLSMSQVSSRGFLAIQLRLFCSGNFFYFYSRKTSLYFIHFAECETIFNHRLQYMRITKLRSLRLPYQCYSAPSLHRCPFILLDEEEGHLQQCSIALQKPHYRKHLL